MTPPLLLSLGQKCGCLGIPRATAVTANHLVPMPNLFQRDSVSPSLTLAQALGDSPAMHSTGVISSQPQGYSINSHK